MLIKNPKITALDRKYYDERAKINEAARAGKLGKSWFVRNLKTGRMEVKPKATFRRV